MALQMAGPCLQVSINVAKSISEQLIQTGATLPQSVQGMGLIDTGASVTCIDEEAAQSLTLPIIDVVQLTSASHAKTPANVYPAHIEILGGANIHFEMPRVVGANLRAQKLIALIGRDVLSRCTFFYNGITGEITLSL